MPLCCPRSRSRPRLETEPEKTGPAAPIERNGDSRNDSEPLVWDDVIDALNFPG